MPQGTSLPLSSSPLRRLSAADFPPEQVAGWIEAGTSPARSSEAPADMAGEGEWLVAYTDPRREDDVARTLRRRSYETYVPVMTVTRRRADIGRPLLPRYVFVRPRSAQPLYGLRETPGLEGLVRTTGNQLARLDPTIVDGLREQERSGVFDFTAARVAADAAAKRAEAARAFKPGLPVRVVDGPYRSFSGRVDAVLPNERISIVMKLFGREFPIPMPLDHVELIKRPLAEPAEPVLAK